MLLLETKNFGIVQQTKWAHRCFHEWRPRTNLFWRRRGTVWNRNFHSLLIDSISDWFREVKHSHGTLLILVSKYSLALLHYETIANASHGKVSIYICKTPWIAVQKRKNEGTTGSSGDWGIATGLTPWPSYLSGRAGEFSCIIPSTDFNDCGKWKPWLEARNMCRVLGQLLRLFTFKA